MKIAIPTENGKLCPHFGHCEKFTFVDVDVDTKTIKNIEVIEPPEHEPGNIPPWINKQGTNLILAGGMGGKAQNLISQYKINFIIGCEEKEPQSLVNDYLNDSLVTGDNSCNHKGCGKH